MNFYNCPICTSIFNGKHISEHYSKCIKNMNTRDKLSEDTYDFYDLIYCIDTELRNIKNTSNKYYNNNENIKIIRFNA